MRSISGNGIIRNKMSRKSNREANDAPSTAQMGSSFSEEVVVENHKIQVYSEVLGLTLSITLEISTGIIQNSPRNSSATRG